jgi:DNA-binding beta-propeller fold protein YncE
VLSTAWMGGNATQFALGADGSRMYVVCDDQIAVLCLTTRDIIGTIGVGEYPSAVAISNDGARLYVADYAGRVTIPENRLRPDAPRGPESVGSHATRAVP